MDIATVAGLVLGTVFLVAAVACAPGASFAGFLDYPSLMIVLGGGLASVLICFPLRTLFSATRVLRRVFVNKQQDLRQLGAQLVSLAETARRDGLLALEDRQEEITHPLIRLGIQLAVDGSRPEVIEDILRSEMESAAARHRSGKSIIEQLARFAPAYGLIGTLLGLIIMLGRLNDPESVGPGMAVALITTLYGAVLSNLVLLPFAEKLAHLNKDEMAAMEMIVRAVLAIQSGEHPRIVEQRLNSFVPPRLRVVQRKAA